VGREGRDSPEGEAIRHELSVRFPTGVSVSVA
jgi:hypothetical protein